MGFIQEGRQSRRYGLRMTILRMTILSIATKGLRHGEERPGEAGARLEPRTAPMQRISYPASCALLPKLA